MSTDSSTPVEGEVVDSATTLEQETIQGEKIMEIVRRVEEVIVDEQRNYIVAALLAISIAAIRPDLIENGKITDAITYLSGEIAMFAPVDVSTDLTAN